MQEEMQEVMLEGMQEVKQEGMQEMLEEMQEETKGVMQEVMQEARFLPRLRMTFLVAQTQTCAEKTQTLRPIVVSQIWFSSFFFYLLIYFFFLCIFSARGCVGWPHLCCEMFGL